MCMTKNLSAIVIVTLCAFPCVGKYSDLFNGKDLSGWNGDPSLWKIENGAITGYVEEGTDIKNHSYLIWQEGNVRDFELSLRLRSDSGNSGIDYRAQRILKDRNGRDLQWTIKGYQADIVQDWMGSFYNWGLAGAQPGQFAIITTSPKDKDGQLTTVFRLADPNIVSGANYYDPDRWNDYTITARGAHMIHRINGFQTIEVIDLSNLKRSEGYLGFQVHAGKKRQIHKFKEIRLEQFDHRFGRPVLLFKNANALEAVDPDDARLTGRSDLALEVCMPNGSAVDTAERFADFILRFQFRRDANRLAVWLRKSEDRGIGIDGTDRHFDRIFRKGDFGLKVVDVGMAAYEEKAAFDPCWDDCEISLAGTELTVKINGRLRSKAINCDRVSGTIGFASNGKENLRNAVLIPVFRQSSRFLMKEHDTDSATVPNHLIATGLLPQKSLPGALPIPFE